MCTTSATRRSPLLLVAAGRPPGVNDVVSVEAATSLHEEGRCRAGTEVTP